MLIVLLDLGGMDLMKMASMGQTGEDLARLVSMEKVTDLMKTDKMEQEDVDLTKMV